jgi:hypothetical protein
MLFQVPVETTNDPLPIIMGFLALGLVWFVIRSIFKFTMRIFMFGIMVILVLGACLVATNAITL